MKYNKRNIVIVMSLLVSLALLSMGTYALWTWDSPANKNVSFSSEWNNSLI